MAQNISGTNILHIGGLEADILSVLWDQDGKGTVREVYEVLLQDRQIAYTTVMTVMTNLWKKELLHQDRSGYAYVYTTTISRGKMLNDAFITVARKLGGRNKATVMSALQDVLRTLRTS